MTIAINSHIYVKSGCNLDLKTNKGTIFSPGYGVTNYPPVLLCSWLIQTEAGHPLLLRFRDFRLQENVDYVQVQLFFSHTYCCKFAFMCYETVNNSNIHIKSNLSIRVFLKKSRYGFNHILPCYKVVFKKVKCKNNYLYKNTHKLKIYK